MTFLSEVRKLGLSDKEIVLCLEFELQGGRSLTNSNVLSLKSRDQSETVRVCRGANGIKSIEFEGANKALRLNELLAAARRAVSPTGGTQVSSLILLSDLELKGCHYFSDDVRVRPCLSEINVGSGLDWFTRQLGGATIGGRQPYTELGPPFPLLLEVRMPCLGNQAIQNLRAIDSLHQMACFCVTLVRGVYQFTGSTHERTWVGTLEPEATEVSYHLMAPGLGTRQGGFYDEWETGSWSEAPIFDRETSYYDELFLGGRNELVFPRDASRNFATLQSMDADKRSLLFRACFFFASGVQNRNCGEIQFICYSCAIECLLPPRGIDICQSCGKPAGKGIGKTFNEFLDRFAPVPTSLKEHSKRLYGIRSQLVHGIRADRVDLGFASPFRDDVSPMLLEWLARKSICGWLTSQATEQP